MPSLLKRKNLSVHHDFRLVAARILIWEKEPWRDQGFVALVRLGLQHVIEENDVGTQNRAEAEMLTRKLREVGRRPPGV